jgi:hypothetical protein
MNSHLPLVFFKNRNAKQKLGLLGAKYGEVDRLYRKECMRRYNLVIGALGARIVFICLHGRPRQAMDVLQPAGFLYRPRWTFQLWPPDAPAPTDAFRTLEAEIGTYGRRMRTGNFD